MEEKLEVKSIRNGGRGRKRKTMSGLELTIPTKYFISSSQQPMKRSIITSILPRRKQVTKK
jgi:hypothetical protein